MFVDVIVFIGCAGVVISDIVGVAVSDGTAVVSLFPVEDIGFVGLSLVMYVGEDVVGDVIIVVGPVFAISEVLDAVKSLGTV